MLSGEKKTVDITGVNSNDNLCDSLVLNFESDRVVVGTTRNDNTGQIKIYDYDEYFSGTATANTWVLAASIYGNTNSKFGKSVDMNYDGNRIVVGAPGENKVYVYDATSTSDNIWQTYVSNTITGTIGSDFGWSVSIARDISTKIAIGSPSENKVYMYELINSTWSQTWSNIATDVPNRVPLTATTDIYMDSNNASYGYSVDLAAFGRFLAIGAPGVLTTISSSNSTYTGGTTFGDTYYDIGERLYKIVPKTGGIFQRGYIRCFATSNVNSSWAIYSEVTQHGQILYGSTLSNLSNFPGINTTASWSLAGLGFSVSISFDGTKVVGGEPFYSIPGTESSQHKGNVRAWVFNNVKITNNWEELTSSAATWFGDKFGYAVKLDYDGGRLAVGSTKRWSGGSENESEDHGGVHVFDFSETAFYEVSPGNNDFPDETGHVAVAITNGKVVACGVRDFLSNYSGKVRFYNMVLTQVIKGNTLNGGYIAADALYIGPNDNLADNSFRKRISFGGTFSDNKYDAAEIENRSFSTNLAYKGHSELFFVKKSVGAGGDGGRDMIRLKANEIQLHNYITRGGGSDDGKYDMYPRLTMNEEGNFKLNAEFLYGQQGWSYSSCDVKALLDINGDTFCRGKINAGHKNRSNTRGITRELGIIFYDTRNRDIISGTSVKSMEMTELIRENRPGTIVGSVQYNDDASAFKINTLSSYIYNNEGGYAHNHEGLKLSCWIKLTKLHNQYSASGETILSAGNLSDNFSKCQIYNEGIQIRYNSGYLLKKSVTLTKDRWYHLFFYLSNRTNVPSIGNNYIWIDGVSQTLIGSGSTSTAPSSADSNFYVGSTTDSIIDAYIGMVHARNTNNGDTNRSLNALDLYNNGPPSERLSVGGQAIIEQKLGIGTVNPNYELDITGDINFTGTIYQNGVVFSGGGGGGGSSVWLFDNETDTYPTSTMTSASSSGYIASASSSSTNAWKAFNNVVGLDGWVSSVTDYDGSPNGTYTGSISTTYNVSSIIYGEWIQLQVPVSITISSIQIAPITNNASYCAGDGIILGSTNGSTWIEIHSFSNQTYIDGQYTTISFTNSVAYSYFRIVVNRTSSNFGSRSSLFISEIKLVVGIINIYFNTGNVGIATTVPAYNLDVAGDINFTGTLYQNGVAFSGGSGSSVWTELNSNIYYNSGNVGIGIVNPAYKLDVNGDIGLFGKIHSYDASTSFGFEYVGVYEFVVIANNSESMRINYYGNVGIGTSSPQYKLDVAGDINFTGTLYQNGVAFSGGGGSGSSVWSLNGTNAYYNNGNVGIGTSTPAYKLDIAGTTGGDALISSHIDNDIILFDDQKSTTTFTGTLYGGATRDTADNYIILASGVNSQNRTVSWPIHLPNYWTCEFDWLATTTGADETQFIFYATVPITSVIPVDTNASTASGFSVTFEFYEGDRIVIKNNLGTIVASSVVTFTSLSFYKVVITFNRGYLSVSLTLNTTILQLNHDFGEISQAYTSGKYMGFGGRTGGVSSSQFIRNIKVTKGCPFVHQNNNLSYMNGNLGIGMYSPGYELDVVGDINFTGTLYQNGVEFSSGGGGGSTTVEWTQQKLTTSDIEANDFLGYSVSISGDYAIVGAILEDPSGINDAGSAYIFTRNGTTGVWSQQQKLVASDPGNYDQFGHSVSIAGDYAVVGARLEDPFNTTDAGSAYIFVRIGTTWFQQAKLVASDRGDTDLFGWSVAISGDYVIVGAALEDPNGISDAGSAYIFKRDGSTWSQQAKLVASDPEITDLFGYSVSISGDYAIVGAYLENPGGTSNAGSAYIFKRDGTTWSQQAKLTASDGETSDLFGHSVSISGDYAIVGAILNGISDTGSAYIFKRNGTTWSQQVKLTAGDPGNGNQFGHSVSISGDYAIVGAMLEDPSGISNAGSGYIFVRDTELDTWSELQKIVAGDGADSDQFGYSVAISGGYAIVGAPYKDHIPVDSGSVYIFNSSTATISASTVWSLNATNAYYNNGNVGIGTSNPTAPLHINNSTSASSSASPLAYFENIAGDAYVTISGNEPFLEFYGDNYGDAFIMGFKQNFNVSGFVIERPSSIVGVGETFIIGIDGNVGIGTSSPTCKLDVIGYVCFSGDGSSPNAIVHAKRIGTSGEASMYIQSYSDNTGDQASLFLGTPHVNASTAQPKCAIIADSVNSWSRADLHFCVETTADNSANYKASISNSRMMISGITGNVGIGTTSPAYNLDVVGDINFTGILYQTSDDRLKENETRIENALNTICKLDPQTYDKRPDLESNVFTYEAGLIAQDIYYDVPELRYLVHVPSDATPSETKPESGSDIQVDPDYSDWGTTPASVNYIGLIPYLIKSIQELKDENDALKARVTALES